MYTAEKKRAARWPLFRSLCALVALCPGLAMSAPAVAVKPMTIMRLASLEWQPYVSNKLEQHGWSSYVASAAGSQVGYQAVIAYFPWTRAVQLGTKDPNYAGYFPAYFTEERAKSCHFSRPIGSSTVGFAYLKNAPLAWTSLQDLAALRVGVVAGFSNGPEFDAWARDGRIKPDASPSDVLNLRKLLAGRVDTVVIDKLVLRYLLATEPSVGRERLRIAFHEKPLAELTLHVCFQRSAEGLAMQQSFDQALSTMPLRQLESAYFRRLEAAALLP